MNRNRTSAPKPPILAWSTHPGPLNVNKAKGVSFQVQDMNFNKGVTIKVQDENARFASSKNGIRPKTAPGRATTSPVTASRSSTAAAKTQKRPTTTHGSRTSTNQSKREGESWTNDDEVECVKKKSYIKKRYWRAVQGLSSNEVQKAGTEVREKRQQVKQLYQDWFKVQDEEDVKDAVFPTWKRESHHFRNHNLAWSIPILDNDILGIKKRLDAQRWIKDKKLKRVDEQTKELENMKQIHKAVTAEIHRDPTYKKVKELTNEENQLSMQLEHAEKIRSHYRTCNMIIRKGNMLLEKKIDKLEEVAERLQDEKWELFTIKVEATYLRDDYVSRTNAMAENNRETRTKNETNLNEVKHQIQHEKVPQDILSRIEGLDSRDATRVLKTLAMFSGKKKSIKERAYGPEGVNGPKLRRLAFKVVRMKYEDQKSQLSEQMYRAMKTVQNLTNGESVDQVLAGFKEQKDISIFLEDARGKLLAKHAKLIQQREELQEKRDALVARHSRNIEEYDREGRTKHKEIEMWQSKEKDGEAVKENTGRLIKQIHGALRSISADLMTKDVEPIRGKIRNTIANNPNQFAPKSSDSLLEIRKTIKQLNDVDNNSGNPSFEGEHPTITLQRKVQYQMGELIAKLNEIPKPLRKMVSEKLGFEEPRSPKILHAFQEHAENAVYANPRVAWQRKRRTVGSSDATAELEEEEEMSIETTSPKEDEKDGDAVLSRKEMKDYSKHVIADYEARRFRRDEAAKRRGNWHKYC